MADACRDLAALGCPTVFLKGGHLPDPVTVDLLYDARTRTFLELESPRVDTPNSHGTGCTISSAIAAGLARGLGLPDAVRQAKAYITAALEAGAGFAVGQGHGPVHHFHGWWKV
jgi:hydroxymethylpyrimidine/phosphomethylpyrimidine kinase